MLQSAMKEGLVPCLPRFISCPIFNFLEREGCGRGKKREAKGLSPLTALRNPHRKV